MNNEGMKSEPLRLRKSSEIFSSIVKKMKCANKLKLLEKLVKNHFYKIVIPSTVVFLEFLYQVSLLYLENRLNANFSVLGCNVLS